MWSQTIYGDTYSEVTHQVLDYTDSQYISWNTYESTAYEKIEYFVEAVEKLNEGYTNDQGMFYQNFAQYDAAVALRNVYNGFIDVVITFPVELRIAGIELLNPWANESKTSEKALYWKYLPKTFKIYKVNNKKINEALNEYTYENDIARKTNYAGKQDVRPIHHMFLDQDDGLILLGSYTDINWNKKAVKDCFFKYNPDDVESINSKNRTFANQTTGTATWDCKQIVIRIFETGFDNNNTNIIKNDGSGNSFIENKIYEYVLETEHSYGTTYHGHKPTIDQIKKDLIGKDITANTSINGWSFKGPTPRSYKKYSDFKFFSGINYKLGGIQPLFSPDIFSISEMKMYNYAGKITNKVYIGEWENNTQNVVYYGSKTTKFSEPFDADGVSYIEWHHDMNVPTKYLDCKVFAKFKMEYDTFKRDDVISNLVTADRAPLSLKISNNIVSLNLSEGIGFTNPTTGEFLSFKGKLGVHMDRCGSYDALYSALNVKAHIISAGSTISTTISGDYPFQIYFVIKRLF